MSVKYIKFGASWCQPCKQLDTLLVEKFANNDNAKSMIKHDIDTNRQLALKYGIRSVPTMIKVDDMDNVIETLVGMQTISKLEEFFK